QPRILEQPLEADRLVGCRGDGDHPRRSSPLMRNFMAMTDNGVSWSSLTSKCNPLSRDFVLEIGLRLSLPVPGHVLEFGVAEGHSTRTIRRVLSRYNRFNRLLGRKKEIYAFDSFKGLREKFEKLEAGSFACEPPRIRGTKIIEGYFEDTLTP